MGRLLPHGEGVHPWDLEQRGDVVLLVACARVLRRVVGARACVLAQPVLLHQRRDRGHVELVLKGWKMKK